MRGVEIESVDRLIDFLHCGFVYRAGQGCAQFMAGFNGFGIAVNELLGKAVPPEALVEASARGRAVLVVDSFNLAARPAWVRRHA